MVDQGIFLATNWKKDAVWILEGAEEPEKKVKTCQLPAQTIPQSDLCSSGRELVLSLPAWETMLAVTYLAVRSNDLLGYSHGVQRGTGCLP